jgi:hypothetical protein
MLGFLFERIHFPGVYMPDHARLDIEGVKKEIQRIADYKNPEHQHLLNCLGFTIILDKVKDFCVFDDRPGGGSTFDEQAKPFSLAIEQAIFGPFPEDFIPTSAGHFHKGLPGDDSPEVQLSYPRWSTYNANAYIYASKRQLLLVNDDPRIPILGISEYENPKNNAKALATILSMECVKLVLPKLKPLSAAELRDFRRETEDYVKPFRRAMLRMSKDLNAAISSDATADEVQRQARFLVESQVYPELQELEAVLHTPSKPWYRHIADIARATPPELAAGYSAIPRSMLAIKAIATVLGTLVKIRDDQTEKEKTLNRTGLHYLLKLHDSQR